MGHVSQLLSLCMSLPSRQLPPHGILWPYKSQRKATTEKGKKRRKTQRGSEKKRGEELKN